jgi:hypothetical protein
MSSDYIATRKTLYQSQVNNRLRGTPSDYEVGGHTAPHSNKQERQQLSRGASAVDDWILIQTPFCQRPPLCCKTSECLALDLSLIFLTPTLAASSR